MDYKQIPLNANISPFDERDYQISRLIAPLPSEVFPLEFEISYHGSPKNQGQVGSCVAHSLSYCREIIEERQCNEFKVFSTGYIYGNRRETDFQGEGMYPREALKCLQDYGDVENPLFPYNLDYPSAKQKLEESNPQELHQEASPYKITAYCRLYTISDIKSALMQLGPVTASYPIYDSFYDTGDNGVVPISPPKEHYCGNHMLTILGWKIINNKEYWIILNSWGKWWGDNGYCYIDTTVKATEYWSITDTLLPKEQEDVKEKGDVYSGMLLERLIFTKNDCYKANRQITPTGIMVHSTGANNPNLKRYVGPNDGIIGVNTLNNHWNQSGINVCVHGFIGKDKNGVVRVYQVLPWNWRAWHAGGSANNTHISFEICEDALTDSKYFWEVYSNAAHLCAMLCHMYNIPVNKVICHSEGAALGIASNHSDVMHWFPKFGTDMNKFRADVQRLMEEDEEVNQEQFNVMMAEWQKEQAVKTNVGTWSAEARAWAEKNGIITGDAAGNKQYQNLCTREQVVTFLYRAAKWTLKIFGKTI